MLGLEGPRTEALVITAVPVLACPSACLQRVLLEGSLADGGRQARLACVPVLIVPNPGPAT